MNTREIDVIAINVETNEAFARWGTPANELPQHIKEGMKLAIGDDDWQVVEARPNTAERFIKKGALILILRKVERDAQGIPIQITLVDADSGSVFGQMSSLAAAMPPVFKPQETTLNLEGVLWVVVKAEPATADEYTRTGKVTITLEKVKTVPARDILYSLPTICETIPRVQAVGRERDLSYLPVTAASPLAEANTNNPTSVRPTAAPPENNIYRFHEDFWRQIELVSVSHEKAIETEINEIGIIYREHSENNKGVLGFRKIHIRKQITEPIGQAVSFNDVVSLLPEGSHQYSGIGYGGVGSQEADGLIEDGFAFQVGPLVVYGQQEAGFIKALGLHDYGEKTISSQALANFLGQVLELGDFFLVDWCRGTILRADPGSIESYLETNFY